MKAGQATIALDVVKLATGKMKPGDFILSVAFVLLTQPAIFQELKSMNFDLFYIPEGMLAATVAVMAVAGIFFALVWAGYLRYTHAADGEPWQPKYIFSMIATMVIAPIVADGALGWAVLNGAVFSDISFLLWLVVAVAIVSALVLLLLNYGVKYTVSVFTGAVRDGAEAYDAATAEVQKARSKIRKE